MKKKKYFLLFLHGKKAEGVSDEECIRKFLAGKEHYLSFLYERHRPGLLRYAGSYIRNRQDCEEIVQDVFTDFALLLRSGRYTERGKLSHLLAQIAHACIINHIIKKSKQNGLFTQMPDGFDSAADSGAEENYSPQGKKMKLLRAALRGIKEVPRKIFMFRYHGHISFEEIGKHLSIKPHTAMTIQERTMEKLRKAVDGNT